MGLGGISIWQLLIVLVIVLLLFGTKRLRGLGGDLGGAIKGFKKAVSDDDKQDADADAKKVETNDSTVNETKTREKPEKTEKTESK